MAKNDGITETLSPEAKRRCEIIRNMLTEPNRPKEAVSIFRNAIPAPFMTDRVGQGGRPITAAKRLAEDPRPVGLAVMPNKAFSLGNGPKMISQTMFALDIVPPDYTCIVCHPVENLVEELPSVAELSANGIDVLYDKDGVFGDGDIDISNGAFTCDGRVFSVDYSRLGNLSASAKRIVYAKTVSACRQVIGERAGSYSYSRWGSASYDPVPSTELVAEILSFGEWSFDEMDGWNDFSGDGIGDIAAKLGYGIPDDGRGWNAFEGLVYDKPYNRFSDLFEIWKAKFAEYGLDRDVLVNVIGNGCADKLGRQLLVDGYIETYLSGVPVDDVLA